MIEVNIMPYIYYPLINLMTILKSPKSCVNLNLTSSHCDFSSLIHITILIFTAACNVCKIFLFFLFFL